MTELVIECPLCGKQDQIQVIVACSLPVIIDDGEAVWDWDDVESAGDSTEYQCWSCLNAWQPNEMTADDFVKEYKDD